MGMYKVPKLPVIKKYSLDKYDPELVGLWVEFRQARRGEDERRSGRLEQSNFIYDENGALAGVTPTNSQKDVMRLEVYMTLTGSNIQWSDDTPIFDFTEVNGTPTFDGSEEVFRAIWESLPMELAAGMIKACHDHNINWRTFSELSEADAARKAEAGET